MDAKRIFVMGWSNFAFFGQLYAIGRRETPTPGGSRVAAAAVFAAASPFDDVRWDPFSDALRAGGTSCRLAALPRSSVPIMLVYRTCDAAVAVTPEQATCFGTEPGYTTEPWLAQALAAGLSITPLRIGGREPGNARRTSERRDGSRVHAHDVRRSAALFCRVSLLGQSPDLARRRVQRGEHRRRSRTVDARVPPRPSDALRSS